MERPRFGYIFKKSMRLTRKSIVSAYFISSTVTLLFIYVAPLRSVETKNIFPKWVSGFLPPGNHLTGEFVSITKQTGKITKPQFVSITNTLICTLRLTIIVTFIFWPLLLPLFVYLFAIKIKKPRYYGSSATSYDDKKTNNYGIEYQTFLFFVCFWAILGCGCMCVGVCAQTKKTKQKPRKLANKIKES